MFCGCSIAQGLGIILVGFFQVCRLVTVFSLVIRLDSHCCHNNSCGRRLLLRHAALVEHCDWADHLCNLIFLPLKKLQKVSPTTCSLGKLLVKVPLRPL